MLSVPPLSIRPLDRFEVYALLALRAVPQPFATAVAFSSQSVMTWRTPAQSRGNLFEPTECQPTRIAARCAVFLICSVIVPAGSIFTAHSREA